ncbi:MAG TPA: BlaI/MecI/CopY family transcriptional regulator [Gemmataceae bacterium]|nr:BlaI/MecI/CopY family transcriptional regulator [Gemmataceae bacterium]
MDERQAPVSEAELDVLKTLWEVGPGTVRAVNAALHERGRRWAYTTVQTLLQRLETKGYVVCDRSGAAHVFQAAVSREVLVSRRLRDLADQLCGGTASPLLLALVEDGRLTSEDVQQLRRLLDRLDPPGRRSR